MADDLTTYGDTYDELNEVLQEIYPAIGRASKSVAYQWPGIVEEEDVVQAIATHLWERPGSLKKVAAMEKQAQYRAIVGVGHQIASQERTDYDFYKGSFRYGVDEVKKLLGRGVLIEPVEDFDDAVFDLMEGLEALVTRTPQYVDAITSRYADELIPTRGDEKKRLSDALTSLVNSMNKSNKRRHSERDDGLGTREILSNREAVGRSDSYWNGEDE